MEMEIIRPSLEAAPNTPPLPKHNPFKLNQSGAFILGIAIILVLISGIGGYFLTISQLSHQQIDTEQNTLARPTTRDNPTILALKDGDLYSIQINNLASKKITNGGGFYTTNQYGYWLSPDHTKVVSKQNRTLLLITKDGSRPIFQTELKGDINDVVWRTDSNALLIWQTLKSQEAPSAGYPTLSEILTYDFETNKTTSIKQIDGWGDVAIWDKDTNVIGYTVGGGEGGSFGEYHTLDLTTKNEKTYKTRWINPSTTPDRAEFIVFNDYDEQGNPNDKTIKIYSILNPDKPLRTFASPKDFFRCSPQTASNREHPSNCLGVAKSFWFVDGSMLKSFDTQSGMTSDITILPTVDVDVPSKGNVPGSVVILDVSKDQKTLLILQQITFSKSEYKIYDLNTKQAKSPGFTKGGTTQPEGTISQEGEFWTHEVIGFLY